MNNDREYLRNLVNIIDGNNAPKKAITESKQSLLESKRSQALNEARNLAMLIENSELTEEQLNELLAGLGALGRAAGQAVSGAAKKFGKSVSGAAQRAGGAAMSGLEKTAGAMQAGGERAAQAIGNVALRGADAATNTIQKGVNAASAAAQKAGQAGQAAAQKVSGVAQQAGQAVKSTYQAGEEKAAIKNALQTVTGIQSTLSSMPALKALASKGDNVTLGQIKAELQKLSAAE